MDKVGNKFAAEVAGASSFISPGKGGNENSKIVGLDRESRYRYRRMDMTDAPKFDESELLRFAVLFSAIAVIMR